MVPLSDASSGDEAQAASSATTFFALPTPKRRAKEEPPAPAAPSAPSAAAPPAHSFPAGGSLPPGGSMAPGMGMGIQGPVASGPIAGPAGYPHTGSMQPQTVDEEINRAQSYRVFAIVIGLMFMVSSALIVTIGLVVYGVYVTNDSNGPTEVAHRLEVPPPPRTAPVDTGLPPIPDPPAKAKKSQPAPRPAAPRPASTQPRPAAPAPAPAPAAPVGPAPATIRVPPGSPFTSIEIICSASSYRQRAPFEGGVATRPDVPQEDCEVHFRGGPPAKNFIRGGETKTCTFEGSVHCT